MTAQDKAILDRCYQKAVKNPKVKKENKCIAAAMKKINPTEETQGITVDNTVVKLPKAGSRADMMNSAKARGIKYFRILSKKDLETVLAPATTKETIKAITEAAQAKWKAGWKKNQV